MRVSQTIYIERAADDVFAFVADHGNDTLWRTELESSRVEGEVSSGVGAHLRQTIAYQGRSTEVNLEISEFEQDHRVCFRARGGLRAHGCYDVKPDGPGTLLSVAVTIELKGSETMLERYVRQALTSAVETDLQQLKLVLESQAQA